MGQRAAERALGDDRSGGVGARVLNLARVAYAAFAFWYLARAGDGDAVALIVAGSAAVFAIVSDSRTRAERRLEARGIPSREAWVPVVLIGALIALGGASWSDVLHVVRKDGDIVAFILAFAVISQGMSRCGFFNFMAYRLAERCRGNTAQLILYLFLLSSLLTYFTSNDIVIFTMTPIVIAVAFQTRIRNARLILLSQFVAANTVSMGLLIGSPTNIIVGRATGLSFVEYFLIMLVPSVFSVMVAFIVISAINAVVQRSSGNRFSRVLARAWSYDSTYSLPRFTEYRTVTVDMRRWVWIFVLSIAGLAVATSIGVTLYAVAVPIAIVGTVVLARTESLGSRAGERRSVARTMRDLPYGVVFFALAFFTLASLVGSASATRATVVPQVQGVADDQSALTAIGPIAASGALVNVMNDLPAAALLGEVVHRVHFHDPFSKALTLQGLLVGLNIGTYVTPIGALAGIIWFQVMRRERLVHQRRDVEPTSSIETPSRADMVVYGLTNFVVSCFAIGLVNYFAIAAADELLGPPGRNTLFHGHWFTALTGAALALAIPVVFVRTLRRQNVVLAHMVDFFVVVGRVRVWAARHRVAFAAIVAGAMFTLSAGLLYWSEQFVTTEYEGLPGRPLFHTIREFFSWFIVFVESGFEQQRYPHSLLGGIIAATLALGSLATIIFLVRLSTMGADRTLRFRIASGKIPTDRCAVLHASDGSAALTRAILESGLRFVVAAGRQREAGDLIAQLDGEFSERSLFHDWRGPSAIIDELKLMECRELILLSDSRRDDFENLALLEALDRATTIGEDGASLSYQGPVVLVEVTIESMRDVVAKRVSAAMRESIRVTYLGDVFGEFVAARYSPGLEALGAFFSITGSAADSDATAPMRLVGGSISFEERAIGSVADAFRGSSHDEGSAASSFDLRHPWEGRIRLDRLVNDALSEVDATRVVGVTVDLDRGEHRATLGGFADAHIARVPARAVLAHGAPISGGSPSAPLPPVLIGYGDLLEQTARRLVGAGAERVTLLAPSGYQLPTDLAKEPRLVVERFTRTHDVLTWWDDAAVAATRVLIFDGDGEYEFDVDRLLEHVSVEHARRPASAVAPVVAVQCSFERRYEELRRYSADVVFDSNWIEASYFSCVARFFYQSLSQLERPEDENLAVLFEAADGIARALMRFDVRRAGGVELLLPGQAVAPTAGMTIAQAMTSSRVAFGLHSVVVAVARRAVAADGRQITVSVEGPDSGALISGDDLLLMVPYL